MPIHALTSTAANIEVRALTSNDILCKTIDLITYQNQSVMVKGPLVSKRMMTLGHQPFTMLIGNSEMTNIWRFDYFQYHYDDTLGINSFSVCKNIYFKLYSLEF